MGVGAITCPTRPCRVGSVMADELLGTCITKSHSREAHVRNPGACAQWRQEPTYVVELRRNLRRTEIERDSSRSRNVNLAIELSHEKTAHAATRRMVQGNA